MVATQPIVLTLTDESAAQLRRVTVAVLGTDSKIAAAMVVQRLLAIMAAGVEQLTDPEHPGLKLWEGEVFERCFGEWESSGPELST